MFRVLIAALLAAVVLFGYGFVFWTILPSSKAMLAPLRNGAAVVEDLAKVETPTGVYFYPMQDQGAADPNAALDTWRKMHTAGPLIQVYYSKEGADPMSREFFIEAGVYTFASALLAAALLAFCVPALPTYGTRVIFVTLLGGFAALFTRLSDVVFMHHPWEFELYSSAYIISAWLLAGIVLAAFIRPAPVKKLI